MPAPSASRPLSRSRSNGRLARSGSSLRVEHMPAAMISVAGEYSSGASVPPQITASTCPDDDHGPGGRDGVRARTCRRSSTLKAGHVLQPEHFHQTVAWLAC